MQYLGVISKKILISVHFQGKPFNITVIYAQTSNAEEAEVDGSMKIYKTF